MAHHWALTSLLLVVLWTTSSSFRLGESVDIYPHNGSADVQPPVHQKEGRLVRIKGYVEEEDGRLWIECHATQSTGLEWLKNGMLISTTEPGVGILSQEDPEKGEAFSKLIVDMQAEYEGEYSCRDVNNPSYQDTITISHPTTSAPTPAPRQRIDITREDFSVTDGEMFSIECRGNMNASLFWTHNNARLLPGHDVTMMTTMTTSGEQVTSVGIMSASLRWAGNYSCMDHLDLTNQDSVQVTVLRNNAAVAAIRILSPDADVNVEEGEPFTLICAGAASTRPTWYLNDQPLGYQPNLLVTNTIDFITLDLVAILTKLSPDTSSSGVYSCKDMGGGEAHVQRRVTVNPKEG